MSQARISRTLAQERDVPLLHAHGAAIPAVGFGTGSITGEVTARAVETAIHRLSPYRYGAQVWQRGGSGRGHPQSRRSAQRAVSDDEGFHENLHAADFATSVEDSLRAIGVNYFDLLLVHWTNPRIPLAETREALAREKRRGVAMHIGLANFTTALLDQAVALCPEPLVCNQVEFQPYLDQSKRSFLRIASTGWR